jgi:hypothetical protein
MYKPASDFSPAKEKKCGLASKCRPCEREYVKRPDIKARRQAYCRQWDKERRLSSPRHTFQRALGVLQRRKKSRNPVTVDDLMDLWNSQRGLCALSGIPMTFGLGREDGAIYPTAVSLDRINRKLGYDKGNVRLVCWQANSFRGPWSDEQMISVARAIVGVADAKK